MQKQGNASGARQGNPGDKLVCYHASKSIKKKMDLPPYPKWKVCDEDIACDGAVVLYTKMKGLFFDGFSTVKPRYACLTRNGFLVVYMKDRKGHILNIPTATSIECKTEVMKKSTTYGGGFYGFVLQRRCRIKIRFPSGNVYMYVMNSEVAKWRDALNSAYDALARSTIKKREQRGLAVPLAISCPSAAQPLKVPSNAPPVLANNKVPVPKVESEAEEFPDVTRTISFSQRDEESFMEDCASHRKAMSNFRVYKRKLSKHNIIIEEVEDEDDSTNSGFLTEYSTTEGSVRANPAFSVRELRSRLEGSLNRTLEKKLEKSAQHTPVSQKSQKVKVARPVNSEDFSDLNYWHRDLNSSIA